MKARFFTVLIDTYNHGHFVEEAVSSVLAQNFPAEEREIVVVDDGSTDDTQERLRKFGNAIRYLCKPNGGQASAFNFGFEHASGEVIALLDADDVWLPGKLERVSEAFECNPDVGMVYHRAWFWNDANESSEDRVFVPVSGRIPERRSFLLQYPMVSTSSLAFRRNVLRELFPVPEALRSQADAYLTALIIFLAPVVAVPEYLGKYRIHGANLFYQDAKRASRSRVEHRMVMRGVLLAAIQNWLRQHGYDLNSPDICAYLKQWIKAQERDAFVLNAPSPLEYFRHLIEYPRIYGEIMTPRHRAYSYVRAFAALLLGYHHLHLLDDLQRKRKRWFLASSGNSADGEEKASATKS
jgi:glycosyltransferase involved in cell wall biosynthesis